MNLQIYKKKNLLMLIYKKYNLPFGFIREINNFIKEKLYQCSDCPTYIYTINDFDTIYEFNRFKLSYPNICTPNTLKKWPLRIMKKCGSCNKSLLCPRHALLALKWGKHYRNIHMYLCDNCCWFEIS